MARIPISVTLDVENLTWLRGRAGAGGGRSVSAVLDAIVTRAGRTPVQPGSLRRAHRGRRAPDRPAAADARRRHLRLRSDSRDLVGLNARQSSTASMVPPSANAADFTCSYRFLNAAVGSTLAARRAGRKQATSAARRNGAGTSCRPEPARFPRLSGPYLGQAPPGMTPQLFAKGIVSTRQGVYSTIVFSLEHGEAFWHPEGEGVLFVRVEGGPWSTPRPFPFTARPSINVPLLAPDGRRLYFMAGTRDAGGMVDKEEIWFVERTSNGWSEPRAFDPTVNSVPMHWQFSMDRQGNVYLSAGRHRRHRVRPV